MNVDLSKFDNAWYNPGRSFPIRMLWLFTNALFLQTSSNPSSKLKVLLLRLFGARIGHGVVLKPAINVKYPWNLEIGDHSWIGEAVWLDSLAPITIGSNVCVSQGVFLCTGNHDWGDPSFGLIIQPIKIEDGAWVGARAMILPGVTVGFHSIVSAGAVISKNTDPYLIYSGNPAVAVSHRELR